MMNTKLDLAELGERLERARLDEYRVVTGFCAFVDEVISLVGERTSVTEFTPVPDIATFGHLVTAAAGHNSLREIVVKAVHPGGCAVNLSDGLTSLGVAVDCFGTLGDPVHPAFRKIGAKCRSFHSWGREPGRTLAFEFSDGKVMFSSVQQLSTFTPDAVREFLRSGKYQEACAEAGVIVLADWTLYPHMTEVWRLLQRDVFSRLRQTPQFLIDLVDPSGRSPSDTLKMLRTLPAFESAGPLTLGLNGNEANVLCHRLELDTLESNPGPQETLFQAMALRSRLKITRVVIHRAKFAVSSSREGEFAQETHFCQNPAKTTGAGDRFNAGLCLGLLLNWPPLGCLGLANAVSGFFVRNGRSPNLAEVVAFLRHKREGSCGS